MADALRPSRHPRLGGSRRLRRSGDAPAAAGCGAASACRSGSRRAADAGSGRGAGHAHDSASVAAPVAGASTEPPWVGRPGCRRAAAPHVRLATAPAPATAAGAGRGGSGVAAGGSTAGAAQPSVGGRPLPGRGRDAGSRPGGRAGRRPRCGRCLALVASPRAGRTPRRPRRRLVGLPVGAQRRAAVARCPRLCDLGLATCRRRGASVSLAAAGGPAAQRRRSTQRQRGHRAASAPVRARWRSRWPVPAAGARRRSSWRRAVDRRAPGLASDRRGSVAPRRRRCAAGVAAGAPP